MALLNYTTSISAEKTVGEIMGILTRHRARAILMNYSGDGSIEALSFQIDTAQGRIGIRLPVDPDAVLKVMDRQGVPKRYLTREQALRVAWRIIKDWMRAQVAIIDTEMVRMEQVFLPYMMVKKDQTLYEAMRDRDFLLGEGGE